MSLFTRTYLTLSLALVIGLLATIVIIDNSFEDEDGRIFKAEALAEAQLATKWLQPYAQETWLMAIQDYSPLLDFDVSIKSVEQMARIEGIVVDKGNNKVQASVEPWMDWWSIHPIADSGLYLLIEDTEDEEFSSEDWLETVLPFVSLFIVLAIGILTLSRKIATYINELIQTTSAIRDGDWHIRANTQVPEPIKSMALSVNAMAEQLQRTMQDQQIAIGAIPHEVRSPIARMRFALDMTQQSQNLDIAQQRIEDVDHFLDDLEQTVESTLALIREAQHSTLLDGLLDATELADELRHHYMVDRSATEKQKAPKIDIAISNSEVTHGSLQHLKQASINLIDNALRYGDSHVSILLSTTQEESSIIVNDDGEGVPLAFRGDIFSPFYRIDKSRTRNTGGTGLGLALVRLIIEKHKGSVQITDSPLGGAQFTLRW